MNQRSYTTPLKSSSVPFRAVGVWRAVVTEVVGAQVSVRVPRLSGDLEYGPIDVVMPNDAGLPAVDDPVIVGFVEGRQDELVVLGVVRTSDEGGLGGFTGVSVTTTTTAAGQTLDSVPASSYRSVKFVVQATSGTDYRVSELLVLHDGSGASFTEYGVIVSGTDPVTSYDADVVGGNLLLTVTPAASPVTFQVSRAAVPV